MYKLFIILTSITLLIACSSDDNSGAKDPICNSLICDSTVLFSAYQKTDGIVYGINESAHVMSVYEPVDDERDLRPLVILLSGGGFTAINIEFLAPLAEELVKYGFVVATAGYRTGNASPGIPYLSRAIEAQQDSRAAVRYFRKNASQWHIDPDAIIIGGWSAGAITAISHAYVDNDDLNDIYSDVTCLPFLETIDGLGGIEGNQGNDGFSSSVSGVIFLAGVLNNANEAIQEGEPPIFAVHGTLDSVIPDIAQPTDTGCDGLFNYTTTPLIAHTNSVGILSDSYIIEGGNHSSPVNAPDQYIQELIEFLRLVIR